MKKFTIKCIKCSDNNNLLNTYKDNMKAITDNKRTKYIRRLFRRYEG